MAASKQADLEAWETALRAAVLSAGAKVLEQLLQGIGSGREPRAIVCKCGTRMESQGLKHKEVLTILGPCHLLAFDVSMSRLPKHTVSG